jgi:MFS family permease
MVATAKVSQSVVGRARAKQRRGLLGMMDNPYVFMTCAFASIGCIMYGYDQGVMSSVLVMQNFEAEFPDLMGDTIQGWLVAALELGAWAGALICGPLSDRISRKYSMLVAVIIFTVGTCLQAAAKTGSMLFGGRVVGGVGIGMFSVGLAASYPLSSWSRCPPCSAMNCILTS